LHALQALTGTLAGSTLWKIYTQHMAMTTASSWSLQEALKIGNDGSNNDGRDNGADLQSALVDCGLPIYSGQNRHLRRC